VEGTDTGHEDGEAMASVGVGLTVMLGHRYWFWVLHFMCETAPRRRGCCIFAPITLCAWQILPPRPHAGNRD
jgi:hypothetical protein